MFSMDKQTLFYSDFRGNTQDVEKLKKILNFDSIPFNSTADKIIQEHQGKEYKSQLGRFLHTFLLLH